MKLIIDIPDHEYKYTCERTLHNRSIWDDAIRNGTPLDDVKAEMKSLIDWHDCPIELDGGNDSWYCQAVNQCLEIIDKHIGKAERNDKE